MADDEKRYIPGYTAEIPPALWKRVLAYGVPHYWFAVWVVGAMAQVAFLSIGILRPRVGLIHAVMPVVFLCGAELMVLQWVTRLDMDWDNLILRHLIAWWPRYLGAR